MEWNDPLRLGIHEVGHVVVEYVLTGVARACFVYTHEDGSYGAHTDTQEAAAASQGMAAWAYLHLAAGFLGGWAAVHLAIEGGVLPRAPIEIEAVAGDHGYVGSDEEYALWAATQADKEDPAAILVKARELALDVLRPRLDQVIELGGVAAGSSLVSEHLLRSTIAR